MPRISGIVVKGYPHHIIQRENYQQIVFSRDSDYESYLKHLYDFQAWV
jgi:REP element-mobilizing transposase RayT